MLHSHSSSIDSLHDIKHVSSSNTLDKYNEYRPLMSSGSSNEKSFPCSCQRPNSEWVNHSHVKQYIMCPDGHWHYMWRQAYICPVTNKIF